ncbi:MAG: hypothetical protein J5700_03210, partial [Treponema sp.]|nr:hypothetical protein [Treponema sp.]
MKKIISTIFVAALFVVTNAYSQSNANVTYKQMVQANTRQALAARHKNWRVLSIVANSQKKSEQVKAYGRFWYMSYSEPDMMYFEDKSAGMIVPGVEIETGLYTRSGTYFNDSNSDGTESFSVQWAVMNENEKRENIKMLDSFAIVEDGENIGEVLVSSVDNGDGTITLTTNAPATQACDIENVPSKWKKLNVEYKYLLDAKTLECKSIDVSVLTKKGKIDFFKQEIEYDIKYEGNPNLQNLRDFE